MPCIINSNVLKIVGAARFFLFIEKLKPIHFLKEFQGQQSFMQDYFIIYNYDYIKKIREPSLTTANQVSSFSIFQSISIPAIVSHPDLLMGSFYLSWTVLKNQTIVVVLSTCIPHVLNFVHIVINFHPHHR